jgi:hypothetical protein
MQLFCSVFEEESMGEDKEDDSESFRHIGVADDREGFLDVWAFELDDTRAGEEEGLGYKEEFSLVECVLWFRIIKISVDEEETDAHSLGLFRD